MSIEKRIQALAAAAAPLRKLEDDDPKKVPLTGIVDEINALRALQARGMDTEDDDDETEVKP